MKYIFFKNFSKKIYIIIFLFTCISCEQKGKKILIIGDIINLPDGVLYLCKDSYINKIDSVSTINGKFTFTDDLQSEPIYLALHHIDKKGVFRAISFPTNAKYNNSGYNSSVFLSDSIVLINGAFTDNTPQNIMVGKTKFVTSPKIRAGYQTNALFHTDGDLFDNINKYTYKKVASKIKEYSNSFHLLYQINNHRNSFTASQTQNLLRLFHGEVIDSETFIKLKEYNEKRFTKKKLVLPLLKDNNGKKTEILDTKFKKHLVVFWASWCGPCRQEIPALKKMYSKYKNDIEFVSISTDSNNALWQKALEKENMSWKQLIVKEKSNEYEPLEIFFQLSNSIPYIALVDNNIKVLKSHVGSMAANEMEEFIKN
jgi:thiol-disulfide isomerase/thioredoxin